jgi:hypothetical protein
LPLLIQKTKPAGYRASPLKMITLP